MAKNKLELEEIVEKSLKQAGLWSEVKDRLSQPGTSLSGGQQQRVAIALAVIARPRVLLADEPTANLDSVSGNNVLDLMRSLNEEHSVTFIFSTHDPEVMGRARRVITLRDGLVTNDETRS